MMQLVGTSKQLGKLLATDGHCKNVNGAPHQLLSRLAQGDGGQVAIGSLAADPAVARLENRVAAAGGGRQGRDSREAPGSPCAVLE